MHSFKRSVWQGPLGLGFAVAFAAVTLDAERSALGIQGPQNDKSQADSAIESKKATRSISGILVDRAGFPVSHAYIAVAGTDIWKGARSDEQGRFTLNKVPNEARAMIAVSRRSNRMGVASISPVSSKDVQLVLDCDTTWALGWVVDFERQSGQSSRRHTSRHGAERRFLHGARQIRQIRAD